MFGALSKWCMGMLSFILFCSAALLSAAEKAAVDPDHGWVSTLTYTPDSGVVFSLVSMRDGKTVPVFLSAGTGSSRVVADKKRYAIKDVVFTKKNRQHGVYDYRFRDLYMAAVRILQQGPWEFSIKRKITALRDIKLQWWEDYLNSGLVAGRKFSGDGKVGSVTISKAPLPVSKMFETLGKGKNFRKGSIDSAIGKIDLQMSAPMLLVDHRKAPWRRQYAHLLYNSFSMKKGQSLELDMSVKITPDFARLKVYQPVATEKDIYTAESPVSSRHIVVPSPQKVTWGKGRFHLGHDAYLFCDLKDKDVVRRTEKFFADMFRIEIHPQAIGKQLKHCLVLTDGKKRPGQFARELEQMRKTVAGLKPDGSYELRVVNGAVLVAGKTARGVWNGLMTLCQLSRHQVGVGGIDYDRVNIVDYPDFIHRGIYVRICSNLDLDWSRKFVEVMSELKYNQAYLHFASGIGVRFSSQPGCYDRSRSSISPEEFAGFAQDIKRCNMEIIPIWAAGKTMLSKQHFKKFPKLAAMTINQDKNWDISLDKVFAYNKSILDELIKLTGAGTVHLGVDEIYHFARHCRKNTGRGDVILADYINKFTDAYAPRGIKTIVYHDMFINPQKVSREKGGFAANASDGSENAVSLLRNRKMLRIEDWSYSENKIYADFDYLHSKGLDVYGSCWYRYNNIVGLSAYTRGRSDTFVCTYWSQPRKNRKRGWDPRGTRNLKNRFKTYKFLPAMTLAAEEAWNAGHSNLTFNFLEETLRLFDQRKGEMAPEKDCKEFDLSRLANRDLADLRPGDGKGFIDQGFGMDLSAFPAGKRVLGGIPFLVPENRQHQARAVAVKGPYTAKLPQKVTIPLNPGLYDRLVFLHTCHFDFEDRDINKNLHVSYVVNYKDGSTRAIKLVNDENIMAWAPALTRFDPADNNLWLAWTGMTRDNLPTAVYGYTWKNPSLKKAIKSIELQAEKNTEASVFLLALTGIKASSDH